MRTIGLLSGHEPDEIPASHRDLAQCPQRLRETRVICRIHPDESPSMRST
jgi:hypothetical protein